MSDASLSAGEILLRLTASATLAAGALLSGAGSATLSTLALGTAGRVLVAGASAPAWSDSGLSYASGVLAIAGSAPGTPSAGQVLVGGGAIKAGGAVSCTALTASDVVRGLALQVGDGTDAGYGVYTLGAGNRALHVSRATDSGGKTWAFGDGAGDAAAGTWGVVCFSDTTTPAFTVTGAGAATFASSVSCAGLTSTDTIFSSNGTVQTIMSYGSTHGTIGTNSAHDLYLIRGGSQKATLTASAFNLSSGVALQINGIQIVGAQGAAVADASGGATVDAEARTAINTLLARMRAHGAIAT